MIDLWKYEYSGKVKIVDVDGNVYIGVAKEVTDLEERSEDERQELCITIECDGSLIEFFQSDIKTIQYDAESL